MVLAVWRQAGGDGMWHAATRSVSRSSLGYYGREAPLLSGMKGGVGTMAAPHPTLWPPPLQIPEEALAQAGLHVPATAWGAQDQTPVGCPCTEVGLKSVPGAMGLRKRKWNLNPRLHRHRVTPPPPALWVQHMQNIQRDGRYFWG